MLGGAKSFLLEIIYALRTKNNPKVLKTVLRFRGSRGAAKMVCPGIKLAEYLGEKGGGGGAPCLGE